MRAVLVTTSVASVSDKILVGWARETELEGEGPPAALQNLRFSRPIHGLKLFLFGMHFPCGLICPHARIGREHHAWRPVTGKGAAPSSPGPVSSHRDLELLEQSTARPARERTQTTWGPTQRKRFPVNPHGSSPLRIFVGKPTAYIMGQASASRDSGSSRSTIGHEEPGERVMGPRSVFLPDRRASPSTWGAHPRWAEIHGRGPRTRFSLVDEKPSCNVSWDGKEPWGCLLNLKLPCLSRNPRGRHTPAHAPIGIFYLCRGFLAFIPPLLPAPNHHQTRPCSPPFLIFLHLGKSKERSPTRPPCAPDQW